MTVRVTADILFVGDLQVTAGGVSLFTKIEVPAGSTKEYVLEVPAAGSASRVVVRLYPEGSEDHLVQESVSVQYPGEQRLVGIVGAPQAEPGLVAAGSVPFGHPLAILDLAPADLAVDLAPLSYLVIGDGALAATSPDVLSSIGEWVGEGGRLVGAVDDLRRIDANAGPATALTDEATIAAVGAGELVWSTALPMSLIGARSFGMSRRLVSAPSSSSRTSDSR